MKGANVAVRLMPLASRKVWADSKRDHRNDLVRVPYSKRSHRLTYTNHIAVRAIGLGNRGHTSSLKLDSYIHACVHVSVEMCHTQNINTRYCSSYHSNNSENQNTLFVIVTDVCTSLIFIVEHPPQGSTKRIKNKTTTCNLTISWISL
jgi:hypothetical protein